MTEEEVLAGTIRIDELNSRLIELDARIQMALDTGNKAVFDECTAEIEEVMAEFNPLMDRLEAHAGLPPICNADGTELLS